MTHNLFLEILAAVTSTLNTQRQPAMKRNAPQGRDLDGNVIDSIPTEVQPYKYGTGSVPSRQFEELVRLLVDDEIHGCLVYHQMIQGK